MYNSICKTTVEQSLTRLKVRGTLVLYGSASGDVPPLDLTKLASLGSLYAKYKAAMHETMTEAESNVWERMQSLIYRFQKADRIVLKTPMWNFGLPYKLRLLIDLVTQRNYMFAYDGKQYSPSLEREKGNRRLYTRFTFSGGYFHPAAAIRSPSNVFGLLVAPCRCSSSSERDC